MTSVTTIDVVVGLVILVGLMGIVVPVLPGSFLVLGAVGVWAALTSGATAWTAFAVAAVLIAIATVVKFLVPGRRLTSAGVPTSTLWAGGALGLVGFFVIPVVGLFLGFVLGIYLAELRRLGTELAWPATRSAVAAVGLSILIELFGALLATAAWVVGVVLV